MNELELVCMCVYHLGGGVDVCWTALTVRPFQPYITEPTSLFPIATLTEVKGYVPRTHHHHLLLLLLYSGVVTDTLNSLTGCRQSGRNHELELELISDTELGSYSHFASDAVLCTFFVSFCFCLYQTRTWYY